MRPGKTRRTHAVKQSRPKPRPPEGASNSKRAAGAKPPPRVLVVGDVMLDRYWFGQVGRISPEAPVPVVLVERSEERPGGAANVARNAAALGADVELLSVIGHDEAGDRLTGLVMSDGVRARLHRDATVPTTVKLRVIGRQQQLLRIDFETLPSHEVLAAKLHDFERSVAANDLVIFSDYAKGALAHVERMIRVARRLGKPVLVDPKGEDYRRYRGATALTPNRAEFRQVAGTWASNAELIAKARRMRSTLGLEALLITRSEEGMTLFRESSVLHVPAQAREVFDVSGAGDTVIATLGVKLASGASWPDAVRAANLAAGIVVGKLGTAVVHPHELAAAAVAQPA
ncbi:MAG: D-glycero-beta-D-manno-heptose-7-phosphate kinase [Burkholderiales bacterium]|nr:D-glycero-beta-D-manno-heptose-7-phosphate kinase [Burkholderiales bacterium]